MFLRKICFMEKIRFTPHTSKKKKPFCDSALDSELKKDYLLLLEEMGTRGVKIWSSLPTDRSKNLPTGRGEGKKSRKFANVLNGQWMSFAKI